AGVVTALAVLLVLWALVAPNELERLTPGAFVRLPLEALLGVALALALPARPRRVLAVVVGLGLGLLTIGKAVDMGFYAVLARPFDPMFDWASVGAGVEFIQTEYGRAGAIGAVVAAGVLAGTVLVAVTLAVLRLARLVVRHDVAARRAVAVLTVGWVALAAAGVRLAPDAPVAASSAASLAYDRVLGIGTGLRDREVFAAELAVDAFADTPGADLLTGLRGKDVIVAFVESYGRDAVEDPEFAPRIGAVLDAGNRRLAAAGYAARSGFLTSSTAGGNSWLAHATLLSGLWINNQQRYRRLVDSDRLTLNRAFRRADWRTVAVMPGITRAWPEGEFFGNDRVYDSRNLGYQGRQFAFGTMPDQYTLSAFERAERAGRAAADRKPLMAEIALISSHGPWTPVPRLIDWADVGDGSVFAAQVAAAEAAGQPAGGWRDATRVRAAYREAIEYSLETLLSYVQTHGGDDLVLVFLGDHQPAPIVTGAGASRDVPITIVARDRAVLARTAGWGWQDGLKPGPTAPVWPMNAFRDRFLAAFSR
ncbi:MAG TPA: sulfatase, partial [Pilimelia sp.]|nr:sulfatase [Pilimelia sp.]